MAADERLQDYYSESRPFAYLDPSHPIDSVLIDYRYRSEGESIPDEAGQRELVAALRRGSPSAEEDFINANKILIAVEAYYLKGLGLTSDQQLARSQTAWVVAGGYFDLEDQELACTECLIYMMDAELADRVPEARCVLTASSRYERVLGIMDFINKSPLPAEERSQYYSEQITREEQPANEFVSTEEPEQIVNEPELEELLESFAEMDIVEFINGGSMLVDVPEPEEVLEPLVEPEQTSEKQKLKKVSGQIVREQAAEKLKYQEILEQIDQERQRWLKGCHEGCLEIFPQLSPAERLVAPLLILSSYAEITKKTGISRVNQAVRRTKVKLNADFPDDSKDPTALVLELYRRGVHYDVLPPKKPLIEALTNESVLIGYLLGNPYSSIASRLHIAPTAARRRVHKMIKVTGARSKAELALMIRIFDTGERRAQHGRPPSETFEAKLGLISLEGYNMDAVLGVMAPPEAEAVRMHHLADEPKTLPQIGKEMGGLSVSTVYRLIRSGTTKANKSLKEGRLTKEKV